MPFGFQIPAPHNLICKSFWFISRYFNMCICLDSRLWPVSCRKSKTCCLGAENSRYVQCAILCIMSDSFWAFHWTPTFPLLESSDIAASLLGNGCSVAYLVSRTWISFIIQWHWIDFHTAQESQLRVRVHHPVMEHTFMQPQLQRNLTQRHTPFQNNHKLSRIWYRTHDSSVFFIVPGLDVSEPFFMLPASWCWVTCTPTFLALSCSRCAKSSTCSGAVKGKVAEQVQQWLTSDLR